MSRRFGFRYICQNVECGFFRPKCPNETLSNITQDTMITTQNHATQLHKRFNLVCCRFYQYLSVFCRCLATIIGVSVDDVLDFRHFGLSPLWFCHRFGLSPILIGLTVVSIYCCCLEYVSTFNHAIAVSLFKQNTEHVLVRFHCNPILVSSQA